MIGTDTGGSSCVPQGHNRTCTTTEKMQATTVDAGTSTTIASSGNTAATTDANTSTTATTASAGTPALQAPSMLSVMDRELKPWGVYDLTGAESPEPLATMQAYFRRFRALRGKSVEGVAHDSLQRSWCAMITRWNRMRHANASFVEWLEAREEVVGNHSLRDLHARVCSNAWDVGRICYVHVREGCAVCGSSDNFSEADWQREVAEQPLGEAEQAWLAKYRRALAEVSMSSSRGGGRRARSRRGSSPPARGRSRSRSRSRPRTREQRPGHPGEEWSVAPMYHRPVETQANALGNAARQESRAWPDYSYGHGYEAWREAGPRAQQYDPRSSAYHQPSQQSAGAARGGSSYAWVAQGDLDEAANRAWDAQAEAEAATTQVAQARTELEAARQSNRELLARTRELERRVFGAPQAAAQPRQSAARTARREGRLLYAPVPEGSSSTG
ncbi:hypothetical protein PR003_g28961 [Phytophthora rubi]|uniref:Uncharacterized protein n=1 Tax=Phytophthora rubi TaxID=129364 RepID=A0A6A3JL41_9STRA|nr:hypothetical protein PR001_g20136 [Phytophthora rubi]KAE9276810.1 hypothetical protein PR003_g28961 [Phytophthora rubi]